MNKKFMLSGVILALTLLLLNSVFALSATNTNPGAGNPGASVSGSFVLTDNIVGNDVTGISFSAANLIGVVDATKNIPASAISFSPASVSTLTEGGSTTIVTTITIPANQNADTYTGTVTITGTENGVAVSTSFALSVVVNSLTALEVQSYDDNNALEIIGEEGNEDLKETFTVKNNGNQVISNLVFDISELTLKDEDNDAITLSFSDSGSINSGETKTITVTADFGDNIDLDTYGGKVTIKQGSSVLDTFKLDLKVFPEVCEDGIVSDGSASSRSTADLEIVDLKKPDNNDNFKIGDEIKVEVKVRNNGEDDLDVVVEAILYNLDQDEEVISVESDAEEIKDGKFETFEFELEVPSSSDLDVSDRYVMFIKVYEDGDEDQNCNFDSVDLKFKREKDDIVIDKVDLTPSTVKPGDSADIRIDLLNEGTKDQSDVYVKIVNNELGIDITSNEFDLDKAGDSDDDITKRFTLVIPENAAEKDYILDVAVYDDNDDVYDKGQEFVTLTVKNGGTSETVGAFNLEVISNTQDIDAKSGSADLHFTFKNNEGKDVTATVELVSVGSWTDSVSPQTVNLHAGDNNLYFTLNLKEDISEGMKSLSVLVKPAGSNTFEQKSYTFNYEVKGASGFSDLFSGEGSTLFWIIGDVVLVIIALFFIKAIFFGKKAA